MLFPRRHMADMILKWTLNDSISGLGGGEKKKTVEESIPTLDALPPGEVSLVDSEMLLMR